MSKWAIIKDGAIDSIVDRPKLVTINEITYGSSIFKIWSDAERWAIGVAKVNEATHIDNRFYVPANPTYAIASAGVVTETRVKASDIDLDTLKAKWTLETKQEAQRLISQFSWQAERKVFANTSVDSDVTTYIAAVVSDCATICGKIDGVDTNAKLAALWVVPDGGVAPINDWPDDSDVVTFKR
jgi:hypothetical protein|tara:strand:+ start:99 stop:650 length:552 start_codon:yes stop_codon:yes gene_type:complete